MTEEFSTPWAICSVHRTSESLQAPRQSLETWLCWEEEGGGHHWGGQKVWKGEGGGRIRDGRGLSFGKGAGVKGSQGYKRFLLH